jgi:hypothetical protein
VRRGNIRWWFAIKTRQDQDRSALRRPTSSGGARASTVDTREGDVVTAPVDFNALLLQGEEDDQCGNSDGAVEGSGGDAESLSAQKSQSGVGEVTH